MRANESLDASKPQYKVLQLGISNISQKLTSKSQNSKICLHGPRNLKLLYFPSETKNVDLTPEFWIFRINFANAVLQPVDLMSKHAVTQHEKMAQGVAFRIWPRNHCSVYFTAYHAGAHMAVVSLKYENVNFAPEIWIFSSEI